MRIQAKDGGSPPRSGTAVVTIVIDRNLMRPRFYPTTYSETINELTNLGQVITSVYANDSDINVGHRFKIIIYMK